MRDTPSVTPGNEQVIDGLERALERAKNGVAKAVGIVFCEHAGADVLYLGDLQARAQVVYGCNLMTHLLITSQSMNVRPLQEQRPANAVKYDLTSDPICFDFLPWLVTAIMRCRFENCPEPLKVAFVRHPGSLAPVTQDKWRFFTKVMRPLLGLFGAIESEDGADGRHTEFVGLREVSKMYHTGIQPPKIMVPEAAAAAMREHLSGRKPITITLREKSAYEHRNSDMAEWDKFAVWLSRQGEDVVVVRDTELATEAFGNFDICPDASTDLHMRAALYTQAKANFFVTNGPWGIAYFTEVPWVVMASVDDDQPEAFNRPQWWNDFMGLNGEKQFPWASPQQRIVYERDTFENLKAAYEMLQLPPPVPRAAFMKGNGMDKTARPTA